MLSTKRWLNHICPRRRGYSRNVGAQVPHRPESLPLTLPERPRFISSPMYTDEDKLKYEIQKLQLDIQDKRRSPFVQATFWLPALAVAVSASGNVLQWSNAKNEKTLADIQVEKALMMKANAERDLDELRRAINGATADYESVRAKVEETKSTLKELQTELEAKKLSGLAQKVEGATDSLDNI